MAKVKYKPAPGEQDETSQFGYDFKDGKAVDIDDPHHLAKFRGNRFFDVSESKAEAKKAEDDANKSPPPAPIDPSIPKPTTTSELRAVHRGRGSWSIMQGGEEVREGLSKDDADAFNEMSAADKAEFVS